VGKADYNLLLKRNLYEKADGTLYRDAGLSDAVGNLVWAAKSTLPSSNLAQNAGDDSLSASAARQYCIGGDCSSSANHIWLGEERYIMNNSGAVRTGGSLSNTPSGVTAGLNDTPRELVYYIKSDGADGWKGQLSAADANAWNSYTLNPGGRNIDLVLLPDIGASALGRLLPAINGIK
jgi:hypothetical protein